MIILVHIYDLDKRIVETNVFFAKNKKKAHLMADIFIQKTQSHLGDNFWKAEKIYCTGSGGKILLDDEISIDYDFED